MKRMKTGIDAGSTTIKFIVMDTSDQIVYKSYRRHQANIRLVLTEELQEISRRFPDTNFSVTLTGSAGIGIAERAGVPFIQEVVASVEVMKRLYPQAKTLIDLGGEDAKMVFLENDKQPDIRMNGSCAGGTGAFIDQMADLMNITVDELGKLALQGERIYPVASRCGVFAKTDVQNLISRKAKTSDIALSILHAVALQSITTLSRGHTICPPVVCIGGPLTYLPTVRKAFQNILKLESTQLLVPENSEYFPAWGCALLNSDNHVDIQELIRKTDTKENTGKDTLPALFKNTAEYREWKQNRKIKTLKSRELQENETLNCFLGIDSGSTTTKILIIDENERVVFNYYTTNQGNPLKKTVEGLQKFYDSAKEKNVEINIITSCSTGYGEDLIKSAFNLDYGIVETAAHFTGAKYVDPNVSFVLDIGGQDMKSIFIDNGAISRIELNEACSSGCGSFLQNFAATVNLSMSEFSEVACLADCPADLGTRCTVFMNSKVKQSLRENASLSDIAAGLACSVIKNCLFKVLKINNLNCLGDNIVAQGGTFRNDAVYRALELLSGKLVSSTDHPELMGALGAALYAKEMVSGKAAAIGASGAALYAKEMVSGKAAAIGGSGATPYAKEMVSGKTAAIGASGAALYAKEMVSGKAAAIGASGATPYAKEMVSGKAAAIGASGTTLSAKKTVSGKTAATGITPLTDLQNIETRELNCKGCSNKCAVLCFKFANGNICYAGNKCEKVFYDKSTAPKKGFNAFELKNEVLFGMRTAGRGKKMGIPRVLNMYENYPFWKTLFEQCGFEPVLSPESTFALYGKGAGYVMSDNLCFPAKLVQGHVLSLLEAGVSRIFYPVVVKEKKESESSCNSYNCPVVSGYPDVIRSAIEPAENYNIPFDKPVITFHNEKALKKGCLKYMSTLGVSEKQFNRAFKAAIAEHKRVKEQLYETQKRLLDSFVANNEPVFIVTGRPYHADPLVQQKTGQILSDLGVNVLTDDVFLQGKNDEFDRLNIVSQWAYPNRTVQAAMEVAKLPQNVQLVQLNSFGCGPDSFFMDETGQILKQAGKNHIVLRIDEIASPSAIRLRLRSMIESLRNAAPPAVNNKYRSYPTIYGKKDREKIILVPWFSDFLSPFIPAVGELGGYKVFNLPKPGKASVETGLKYGNNEVCYPSTLILGDIINALQSGKYDTENCVAAITQTGGQCRASNYLAQIKSGLKNAGFDNVPVLAVTTGKVYQNEQKAFDFPLVKYLNIIIYTLLYADMLQQMYSSTIVKELKRGETQSLFNHYIDLGINAVKRNSHKTLLQLLKQAVADFNNIDVENKSFCKIGLIGEIYVKYNSYGQAHIAEWLREKGLEVVTPPIYDFFMQYFVNSRVNADNGVEQKNRFIRFFNSLAIKYMNKCAKDVQRIVRHFRYYEPSESIFEKAEYASDILDLSNQFGEGWNIAAEVACYAHRGINKVVCVQPFGCIANHVIAKGIEKRLKKFYPQMNMLFLDVDGGTAKVNLHNRLEFLIA